MNAVLALLIGLKYAPGMETLTTLLLVALVSYFGLMYAAKKLKADPDLRDFGAFINKMSILFGIHALTFELLIIVLAYGSVPLFLWSILVLSVAVAVVVLLRLAFVELKEKLMWINGHLMEYWTRFYGRSKNAKLEMTTTVCNTDHEVQDKNQMEELPPPV
ncbi:hypothetical protein RchiOBHm_Chr4g0415081 [Rosa chinensis]|uniref:Uncharacterized protein n=1 Tax=Rosa chinensis TaxID=74649 RepID=A0A2P6QWM2_ROSCH|nr:hypothetical protein RchiOBHm_Chr4g0415081 [Rosa chinensis]